MDLWGDDRGPVPGVGGVWTCGGVRGGPVVGWRVWTRGEVTTVDPWRDGGGGPLVGRRVWTRGEVTTVDP